jgi:hypothetical protein
MYMYIYIIKHTVFREKKIQLVEFSMA